jgi:hypothetical protein
VLSHPYSAVVGPTPEIEVHDSIDGLWRSGTWIQADPTHARMTIASPNVQDRARITGPVPNWLWVDPNLRWAYPFDEPLPYLA